MVSERNAFPVGLRAAINSTKSVEVRIAGMTTIQMVKQKGQCNGDEIHAKIATIRHRISDLSQLGLGSFTSIDLGAYLYSMRPGLTFQLSRARGIDYHHTPKVIQVAHVTPPPLNKAEISVKTTNSGKKP